jgi:hypothetical protein
MKANPATIGSRGLREGNKCDADGGLIGGWA